MLRDISILTRSVSFIECMKLSGERTVSLEVGVNTVGQSMVVPELDIIFMYPSPRAAMSLLVLLAVSSLFCLDCAFFKVLSKCRSSSDC